VPALLAETAVARARAKAAAATAAVVVGGARILASIKVAGQGLQGEEMGPAPDEGAPVTGMEAAGDTMAEELAGVEGGEAGSSRAAVGAAGKRSCPIAGGEATDFGILRRTVPQIEANDFSRE
jgi:hypothetical protein